MISDYYKMKHLKLFEEFNSKYKSSDDEWKKYRYEDFHLDFHHNEHKYKVNMYSGDVKVAFVVYSDFENKIYIDFIESLVKDKGYGTMLMEYLADKYGYENIITPNLTEKGAKMRKRLDKKFNFNYKTHRESLNKHLNPHIIDEIKKKHPIVGEFLSDMIKIGYEETWKKWKEYLLDNDLLNKYDFNDISEISFWIKGSVTNDNNIEDDIPFYVQEEINKLL